MTGALLDLAELAVRAEVPVERVRHYAEAGLLLPARRDGDLFGYPPKEVSAARMLVGADALGLDTGTLAMLAAAWRDSDCGSTQQQLAAAVTDCAGPSCGRSKVATAAFGRLGFRDVGVYEGGKTDWPASGLPFEGDRAGAGAAR
ncbi:hypothetical protein [Paractinoplanes hotanensis]|uniref:Rhodanese domain-containing protein n=1 Tax=Paractinoplanes hotanensis TaxID=2906497 RepID=A0ABT0Y6I7_9ACTN|nr:hypothetical protein [Actinoplanes hotanensis]MCM4081092.1 hypothetical protein [Actinoplanes hotanensis]